MKVITIIIVFFFTINAFSQLAVVNDADGYVNVRYKADKNSKVISKLLNNEVVFCFEPAGNWVNIDYKKNNSDLSGYVYKDRVRLLSALQTIKVVESTNNWLKFSADSVSVLLQTSKFVSIQQKLKYKKNSGSRYLDKINGKHFYGTDGEIPKFMYKRILVVVGRDTLKIPAAEYNDLYEPNLSSTNLNYDSKIHRYYLSAMNGDGAGGYEVVWVFDKTKYLRRYIYNGF